MNLLVVDANIVAKWFVPESLSEQAASLLADRYDLACPDLLWPEIGSVLWKKARAGEITAREAARIITALDGCPLTIFPSRLVIEGAIEIALSTSRSVYDSIYLALAVALECSLVTADQRLVRALAGSPFAPSVVWVGSPEFA